MKDRKNRNARFKEFGSNRGEKLGFEKRDWKLMSECASLPDVEVQTDQICLALVIFSCVLSNIFFDRKTRCATLWWTSQKIPLWPKNSKIISLLRLRSGMVTVTLIPIRPKYSRLATWLWYRTCLGHRHLMPPQSASEGRGNYLSCITTITAFFPSNVPPHGNAFSSTLSLLPSDTTPTRNTIQTQHPVRNCFDSATKPEPSCWNIIIIVALHWGRRRHWGEEGKIHCSRSSDLPKGFLIEHWECWPWSRTWLYGELWDFWFL